MVNAAISGAAQSLATGWLTFKIHVLECKLLILSPAQG
jgi:hypothetical protein